MTTPTPSRRSFLQAASATALGGGSLGALRATAPVHGGRQDRLKIGLVGCGGRGSGAAVQALNADQDVVLWAMGDAFADRIEGSLNGITEAGREGGGFADRIDVPPDRRFAGLDCTDRVLAAGVDVILLASPPGFRPEQMEKAVAKGVHVFCEKPVAVDGQGVRRVLAAAQQAAQKKLCVVSGLCYRYEDGRRALMQKIHEGAIGEILAIQGDYVTGELWMHARRPEWSDLEWQLRNWLYFTWLSGDLIAEQHIHTLDVMAWLKQDVYPVRAWSTGGRQKRTDPAFGNVYDHFATVYEWQDGTRGYSFCRQQNGCFRNVNELVLGTDGRADVFRKRIGGAHEWQFQGKARDMYQAEHDELFAAIRAGTPINNGEYMCHSTLMAIMGRLAAYTGQQVSWEQALNSEEVTMPGKLAMDMALPVPEVAIPGRTRLV